MPDEQPDYQERRMARSSITGRFVRKDYADSNPDTTFMQTISYPTARLTKRLREVRSHRDEAFQQLDRGIT